MQARLAVVSDPSRNQRVIVGRAMLASAVIVFALALRFLNEPK